MGLLMLSLFVFRFGANSILYFLCFSFFNFKLDSLVLDD